MKSVKDKKKIPRVTSITIPSTSPNPNIAAIAARTKKITLTLNIFYHFQQHRKGCAVSAEGEYGVVQVECTKTAIRCLNIYSLGKISHVLNLMR
jgi:hypothetical protein